MENESEFIDEKAASKSQQRLMGQVYALQTGELDPSDINPKFRKQIVKMASTMKPSDVEDFARTKHKGIPEKVKKEGEEKEDDKREYDYGCLMLYFNIKNWDDVTNLIDEKDLYTEEEGYGLEDEPHVTILYGFHDDEVKLNDIKEAIDKVITKPVEIKLTNISCFENDKYDVVKFDVESPVLHKANEVAKEFPHTSDYPDYKPHVTIAYVKSGTGKKYSQKLKNPIILTGNKLVYSHPGEDGEKTKDSWKIGQNILGVQRGISDMTEEKIKIIQDFINFACEKLNIEEPVYIYLRKDRGDDGITTAAYFPYENENHIRVGGRALVDILRSIGHELTHNRQREAGVYKVGDSVQPIGGPIEDKANSIAGILIKDFAFNYGNDKIYEM